jgi:hypothetical protein
MLAFVVIGVCCWRAMAQERFELVMFALQLNRGGGISGASVLQCRQL